MTGHDLVNPAGLPQPSGFNHAVVSGGGRIVWLAGQTALDADGLIVAPGDILAQFEQALRNLLTVLGSAGGHPEHLVIMTVYCLDIEEYPNTVAAHRADLAAAGRYPLSGHGGRGGEPHVGRGGTGRVAGHRRGWR